MNQDTTAARHPVARSGPGPDPFRFVLAHGEEGLNALRDDWESLVRNLHRPAFWHLHSWYECYARALAPDRSLDFVAAYRGRRLIGVLPFSVERSRMYCLATQVLRTPVHAHLPFSDVIVDARFIAPQFFTGLTAFMASQGLVWDVWRITHAPASAYVLRLLEVMRVPHAVSVSKFYYRIIARDYERLAQAFSRKVKENLRRKQRRLAQASAQYTVAVEPESLERAFDAFLDIEASGWKGADGTGTAIKLDTRLAAFYRAVMRSFGQRRACEISVLTLEGKPIAAHFCLIVGGTVYPLKICYDENYASYSPGKVLVDYTVRRALTGGKELNLLSDAPWALDWRPQARTAYSVTLFNRSARGRGAYAASRLDGLSRSVYRHTVRPWIAHWRERDGARKRDVGSPP